MVGSGGKKKGATNEYGVGVLTLRVSERREREEGVPSQFFPVPPLFSSLSFGTGWISQYIHQMKGKTLFSQGLKRSSC